MPPFTEDLDPPVVPIPQDPFLPRARLQRVVNLFPGGQFLRYLAVGGFNTLFGYSTFVLTLTLLSKAVPTRFLPLSAPLASILSTPLNITVAYFGYKIFVFRTKGNHLVEWLKCFAVYGSGMVPGLVALGALTRLLQSQLHRHAIAMHTGLRTLDTYLDAHLGPAPVRVLEHLLHGKNVAGDLAGAIVIALSTVYSFVGHKKVTFKTAPNSAASSTRSFGHLS